MSVLKLSLIFYSCFLVFWLVALALLYSFLSSLGLFDALEDVGRDLVLWDSVNITLGLVERWALLIGIILVIIGSILNLFLAFMYNVISDLVGGVEVTFVEREFGDPRS